MKDLNWQKSVLDSIQEYVCAVDSELKLVYSNPAAVAACRSALGIDLRIGEGLSETFGRERLGRWKSFFERALRGETIHQDVEHELPTGEKAHFEITFEPIRSESTISGVIVLAKSSSEWKERSAKSAFSAKMATLGEMAAGIAHEINNPLAIIHARAGQLRELILRGDQPTETLVHSCEKIEATALRISRVVKGLRAFARDADRDPFELAPVHSILGDTLELCRERFHHKAIAVISPDEKTHGLEIECRPSQITQVLVNLLNNAHDAVEGREEKWVRVDVTDLGNQVEIAVTDSGPGIPDTIREKIMQPFFSTKEPGKGTGLGLSISQSIVASHGGTLSFDPEPPHTRFRVLLPKGQAGSARNKR
jgi:C4-dicarboxylate-specific signal transduction histidine kinase